MILIISKIGSFWEADWGMIVHILWFPLTLRLSLEEGEAVLSPVILGVS